MANANANVKTEVINNIMLQMSMYLEESMLDILQRVIEEQFVFLNMDRITTLPATVDRSTEEQNKYFLGLYKIKKRNLSPKTLEQYIRAMEAFVAVIDKPLTEVDTIDVDYYLRQYETRNVATGGKKNQASTMNNERRYLSAFFTWMRKERFITGNPVEAIEPFKEIRKPIDYFRPVQMEELREGCISVRDRAILEVFRSTGARIGEIVQINREDIDWKTGDVLICGVKGGRYRTIYLDEVARYYLRRYGITDEEIQPLPLRPENRAYVDCMLSAARDGRGAAECMMACLPCMLSYGWIFGELIRRSPGVKDTPYWPFVADYAGNRYDAICKSWSDFTNAVCRDLEPERAQACKEIFRACSRHELHFWEMSARPRADLPPLTIA